MDIREERIHITRGELNDPHLKRQIEVAASQVLRSASIELLDPSYDQPLISIAKRHGLVAITDPEPAGGWVVPD